MAGMMVCHGFFSSGRLWKIDADLLSYLFCPRFSNLLMSDIMEERLDVVLE